METRAANRGLRWVDTARNTCADLGRHFCWTLVVCVFGWAGYFKAGFVDSRTWFSTDALIHCHCHLLSVFFNGIGRAVELCLGFDLTWPQLFFVPALVPRTCLFVSSEGYHGVSQFLLDWIFVPRLSGTSHFFTVSRLRFRSIFHFLFRDLRLSIDAPRSCANFWIFNT